MSERVEAFLDPVCPYSFMLLRSLRAVDAEQRGEVVWRMLPISGSAEGKERAAGAQDAMRDAAHRATWPAVQALAAQEYGLQLAEPGCTTDPRPAAVACAWVRERAPNAVAGFLELLFAAHFARDVDAEPDGPRIDEPATLRTIVAASGVDPAGFEDAFAPARRVQLLEPDREAAARYGLVAVPALRLGGHMLLGAQPASVLRGMFASLSAGASHGLGKPSVPTATAMGAS